MERNTMASARKIQCHKDVNFLSQTLNVLPLIILNRFFCWDFRSFSKTYIEKQAQHTLRKRIKL